MTEPRWMDQPNQPGLWLLESTRERGLPRWAAMFLTQADIDFGAPFFTKRVFGPVDYQDQVPDAGNMVNRVAKQV